MSTGAAPESGQGVVSPPTVEQVTQALASVNDPEIHRPITELGMVKDVQVAADGTVRVGIWLTVAGCPLRDTITRPCRFANPCRTITPCRIRSLIPIS